MIILTFEGKIMWIVFAFISAFCSAILAVFVKLGLSHADVIKMTTVHCLIMSLFFLVVSAIISPTDFFNFSSFSSRQWAFLLANAFLGALGYFAYFKALNLGMASHVVAVDRLSILFAIVLSAILLSETLGLKSLVGTMLVLGGTYLIVS